MSFLDNQLKSSATKIKKRIDKYNEKNNPKISHVSIEASGGVSTIHYSNGRTETFQHGPPTTNDLSPSTVSSVSSPIETIEVSEPITISMIKGVDSKVEGVDIKVVELSNRLDAILNSNLNPTTTTIHPPSTTATSSTPSSNSYEDVYIPQLPAPSKTSTESTGYVVHLMKEMMTNMNDSESELYPHPNDFKTDKDRKDSFLNLFELCNNKNTPVFDKSRYSFEAGYLVLCKKSSTPWGGSTFARTCKIYYELVNLVVATVLNIDESGDQWKLGIKKDIFNVNVYHGNLKDVNIRHNWEEIKKALRNYIRQQQQEQQPPQQQSPPQQDQDDQQ